MITCGLLDGKHVLKSYEAAVNDIDSIVGLFIGEYTHLQLSSPILIGEGISWSMHTQYERFLQTPGCQKIFPSC